MVTKTVPESPKQRSKQRRRCSIATTSDVDLEVWKVKQLEQLINNDNNTEILDLGNTSLSGTAFENFRLSIFAQFQAEFGNQHQWQYREPPSRDENNICLDQEPSPATGPTSREEPNPAGRPKRPKVRRRASVAV